MTESSILWSTTGTGDGTSGGYPQAKLVEWQRALFAKSANLGGVSPTYQNQLAVTGSASPVTVATGAAVCYGYVYFNDAALTVAIPTPASQPRIDRIVLRVNWAAQTVRVTRIAGTEGGGAPALTQAAGTTWDIPLAQVSITTGGVITLTDQREFLDVTGDGVITTAKLVDGAVTANKLAANAVTTSKILDANVTGAKVANASIAAAHMTPNAIQTAHITDGNVTLAKMAVDSVDDSKAAERVVTLPRRSGGTSDWSVIGATQTPGMVKMQVGTVTGGIAGTSGSFTPNFPVVFSATPLVLLTPNGVGSAKILCSVTFISSTGFTIEWTSAVSVTPTFHYIAIGPE
jgi:hypothetical protein